MSLLQKLDNIALPAMRALPDGHATDIGEFWDKFIQEMMPDPVITLRWHSTLMDYVQRPDAMFAVRFYNNAPPARYDDLRRGFLTKTSKEYSFFYTDNFHAAYFAKMALDGYVPSAQELASAYNNRQFPSRFGLDTSNERSMMAIPKGRDPKIQTAGYKLAHIINVGKDYFLNGSTVSLSNVVQSYFPGGARNDYTLHSDDTGSYFAREFPVTSDIKKYLIAEYLRFVHPFNYFLAPKKTCAFSSVTKDIAEYQPVVDFVRDKYTSIYGKAYDEFLNLIMVDKNTFTHSQASTVIDLNYGLGCKQTPRKVAPARPPVKYASATSVADMRTDPPVSKAAELRVVKEYLLNPATSFRTIEKTFLGIDSQTNGGGFVAKRIINSYGVSAAHKGMLAHTTMSEAICNSVGKLKETLQMIAADKPEQPTLKSFFEKHGFTVVDNRNRGGALWVIGEQELLAPYVQQACKLFNAAGSYGSGKASKQKPAWWTKSDR